MVPDFGAPPTFVAFPWWRSDAFRAGTVPHYRYDPKEEDYARLLKLRAGLRKARALVLRHRYGAARSAYAKLLQARSGGEGFCRDRIEIIDQRRRLGEPARFGQYLHASDVYQAGWVKPDDLERVRRALLAVAGDPKAGFLRPHALYVIASIRADMRDESNAGQAFERCARLYPNSPRAESALIQGARSLLARVDPKQKADLAEARRMAAILLTRHPRTRFRADAYGWLGRIDFVQGRYDAAIAWYRKQAHEPRRTAHVFESLAMCYQAKGRIDGVFESHLRMYADAQTTRQKVEAAWYLRLGREVWEPESAHRCALVVRRHPWLLQPYLEFRLNFTDTDRRDLAHLAQLGRQGLRLQGRARLSGGVLAQLAQVAYLRKNYGDARRLADRALALVGSPTEAGNLALYVRAATAVKRRSFTSATADFERLIARSPHGRLVGGARENLALLYEKAGRLGDALAVYSDLEYEDDVAYMLDVRMSPEQINAFLKTRPKHRLRKTAAFALAMRYLRRDRFAEAETWFSKFTRRERLRFAQAVPLKPKSEGDSEHFGYDFWREYVVGGQDPLQTLRELRSLNARVRRSGTSGSRARALYSLAAYYKKHGDLLLYNPSLWHGQRASDYGFFWNKKVELREDRLAWRKHSYEHESLARTRAICLEIVRKYPRSDVAPAAAYTAATCCFTLSGFNEWWRQEDGRAHLDRQGVRLMKVVVRKYPKSKFARPAKKFASVFEAENAERERDAIAERIR